MLNRNHEILFVFQEFDIRAGGQIVCVSSEDAISHHDNIFKFFTLLQKVEHKCFNQSKIYLVVTIISMLAC